MHMNILFAMRHKPEIKEEAKGSFVVTYIFFRRRLHIFKNKTPGNVDSRAKKPPQARCQSFDHALKLKDMPTLIARKGDRQRD
jgi:hypothetical protein